MDPYKMIAHTKEIALLKHIYAVYDEVAGSFAPVCQKYCADCCTCNVTLTTLEGYLILTHLKNSGGLEKIDIKNMSGTYPRFRPRITTNGLAAIYISGSQVEEDENDPSWGRCLFLEEEACTIYSVRPFGCRCLLSRKRCGMNGSAEITPFLLTANTVFMQLIEHIDKEGFSGNMVDMMCWLSNSRRKEDAFPGDTQNKVAGIIPNQPIPRLMVPKEHHEGMKPLMTRLQVFLMEAGVLFR